jgi:limonene-1,2-epoxide hydrolase
MSQENVEVVRAAVDALNRGDFDALLDCWAPEGQLDWSRAVGPINGVFGFDEMRSFWDQLFDPWESSRFEIDELIDVGERVVAKHTTYLRGGAAESRCGLVSSKSGRSARHDHSRMSLSGGAGSPRKPWGCRSKTLTPTPDPAGY